MASKSKRRRKVLGASCILAALIIAGSSFAWFTSKDEVTNRLTATADYGVSLVEDFTPPKDMTPGQEVNKDVSVVNTGSIAAFARLSMTNDVTLKRLTSYDLGTAYTSGTTYYEQVSDGSVMSGNMTDNTHSYDVPSGDKYLYDLRVFGDKSDPGSSKNWVKLNPVETVNADGSVSANEVTTLMAGGQVVIAESTAVAPDKQAVRSGDDVGVTGYSVVYAYENSGTNYLLVKDGSTYYQVTKDQDGYYNKTSTTITVSDVSKLSVDALVRDYSGNGQYVPQGNGLFLFKRAVAKTADDTAAVQQYSGFYYYNKEFYALATKEGNKTAYAVGTVTPDTKNANVVGSLSGFKLQYTESKVTADGTWAVAFLSNADLSTTDSVTTNPNTDATYMRATFSADSKDVVFYIKLADDWKTNWKYVSDTVTNGVGYFYYNDVVQSGETTKKLVDSVTLSKDMTSENYLDMTYDLNVILDSVQVTKDDQGNETDIAIPSTGWASRTLTKDATAPSGDGVPGTIDSIAWS